MYESTWSTVFFAADSLPKYKFHTTTSSWPVVSKPNSEPYGYGVSAHRFCRTCMFAFSVLAMPSSVELPAKPSTRSASRTSRATVPSMNPTPACPSLRHVLPAR